MSREGQVNKLTSEVVFSDFDMSFVKHPHNRDVARITNRDAVKQSVRNIVLTSHWERPFNSQLGSNVRKLLFENITPIVASQLNNMVRFAIENNEPRARWVSGKVTPDYDNNGYSVTVTFRVINDVQPSTIQVFLERIR